MRKYFTVFVVDWQNQFIYRLNFVLWRLRNVLRVLMTFILWSSVFNLRTNAFGYSRDQMVSYVFLVIIVQSVIVSAPSNENIGGEISSGDLSNYLVKPVGYLRYWFTRDFSSKLLNLLFGLGEFVLLAVLFKPHLSIFPSLYSFFATVILLISGLLIFYFITKAAIAVAFWVPENTWGIMFTILVLMEVLSGVIFPLDILPGWGQTLANLTPFPYLIYYPIATAVGKLTFPQVTQVVTGSLIWLLVSFFINQKVWKAGLKAYSASGK